MSCKDIKKPAKLYTKINKIIGKLFFFNKINKKFFQEEKFVRTVVFKFYIGERIVKKELCCLSVEFAIFAVLVCFRRITKSLIYYIFINS